VFHRVNRLSYLELEFLQMLLLWLKLQNVGEQNGD